MLKKWLITILALSTPVFAENSEKDYSIISDDREIRLVFEQCTRMTPTLRTSYQKLDTELVEKVEKMLPSALAKQNNGKPIDMNDYYRQYVSFDLLRRRLVYVNALHKDSLKNWAGDDPSRKEIIADWRNKAITVCGQGGKKQNYWGAIYDSQYDVIAEILFNAPAKKRN